jgi:catechol 2,3-dioxygenase-like lactoylglutathione lyase family enzyme
MKVQKLTPNLIVRDVAASMKFYETVLGLQPAIKVPDQPPYVFGSVTNGTVEIFFNDQKMVAEDYPPLGEDPEGWIITIAEKIK